MAYTQFLNAVDFGLGPSMEVVFAGDPNDDAGVAMLEWVRGRFAPNRVMLWRKPGAEGQRLEGLCAVIRGMEPIDGRPAVYVCEQRACKRPVATLGELKALLS
jgi:hypothetical protein